jgi:hypothetical protein
MAMRAQREPKDLQDLRGLRGSQEPKEIPVTGVRKDIWVLKGILVFRDLRDLPDL